MRLFGNILLKNAQSFGPYILPWNFSGMTNQTKGWEDHIPTSNKDPVYFHNGVQQRCTNASEP